jgi:hypothetical protein
MPEDYVVAKLMHSCGRKNVGKWTVHRIISMEKRDFISKAFCSAELCVCVVCALARGI